MTEENKNNFEILEDKEIQKNEIKENEKLKVYKGYVGFWKRFAAANLDGILMLLLIPAGYLISDKNIYSTIFGIIMIAGIMIHVYYYFKEGRGIGYKLMGFKIIDQETGQKASTKKLIMRVIYKFFPIFITILGSIIVVATRNNGPQTLDMNGFMAIGIGIVIFVILMGLYYLINAIFIGVDKNKKALWDKWAKTLVVSEKEWDGWKIWAINILALVLTGVLQSTPMEKEQYYFGDMKDIDYQDPDMYVDDNIKGSIKINGKEVFNTVSEKQEKN